jgi:hypothetical protein
MTLTLLDGGLGQELMARSTGRPIDQTGGITPMAFHLISAAKLSNNRDHLSNCTDWNHYEKNF